MAQLNFGNLALWALASCVTVAFANASQLATAQPSCVQSCVDSAFEGSGCAKSAWACACNTNTFLTQANACLVGCRGSTKDVLDIVRNACNIAGDSENMVPFSFDSLDQRDSSGAQPHAVLRNPVHRPRAFLEPIIATSTTSRSTSTTETTSSPSSPATSTSSTTSATSTSSSETLTSSSTSSTTRSESNTRSTSSTSSTDTGTSPEASGSGSETTVTKTTTSTKSPASTPSNTETLATTSTSSIPTLSAISPILPTGTLPPISSGSIAQLPSVAPVIDSSAAGIRAQGGFWAAVAIVIGLVF